ncbi:MAG: hypothetical protein K0U19_07425, partial [Proteobacteria bacterium]|nr:hypothetical protein [Pseudomonadota bacterium]
ATTPRYSVILLPSMLGVVVIIMLNIKDAYYTVIFLENSDSGDLRQQAGTKSGQYLLRKRLRSQFVNLL